MAKAQRTRGGVQESVAWYAVCDQEDSAMFPQHLASVEATLDAATMIRSISFEYITLRGMDTWQTLNFHSILQRLKLSFVSLSTS